MSIFDEQGELSQLLRRALAKVLDADAQFVVWSLMEIHSKDSSGKVYRFGML